MLAPVFTHPRCLDHQAGVHHPESPARLRAVLDRVTALDPNAIRHAEPAAVSAIARVHPEPYLQALEATSDAGGGRLDPDTVMNAWSWEAVLGGVGAALAAVESAASGTPAFAAIRPPGHHALLEAPMGFCLVGNVVIAARELQSRGAAKVLIVDWDVHHGNGTQALVERDPSIRFISMHQWPHWPFSGGPEEKGVGNVCNVPMRASLPAAAYVEALWSAVERTTVDFEPDAILVSAGFDSMAGDLLGGFTLEPEDYAEWTNRLRTRFQDRPLAMLLEGGYVPSRVADGVVTVAAAMA